MALGEWLSVSNAREYVARQPAAVGADGAGSNPWSAAAMSFLLFAVGAAIPVVPFAVRTGERAVLASMLASVAALAATGALTSLFTARSAHYAAIRQVLMGCIAAGITYGAGALFAMSLS
jgi:VIT1/CCC1 family predicted Fe2+/Mn2+ transporter